MKTILLQTENYALHNQDRGCGIYYLLLAGVIIAVTYYILKRWRKQPPFRICHEVGKGYDHWLLEERDVFCYVTFDVYNTKFECEAICDFKMEEFKKKNGKSK